VPRRATRAYFIRRWGIHIAKITRLRAGAGIPKLVPNVQAVPAAAAQISVHEPGTGTG